MKRLKESGNRFRLVIAGSQSLNPPECFTWAKPYFQEEILHWGYAELFEQYTSLLAQCDILPVTARHDYFGISTLEAICSGVYPLLPDRLVYPEHVSKDHLYMNNEDLLKKPGLLLNQPGLISEWRKNRSDSSVAYGWDHQITKYVALLEELW